MLTLFQRGVSLKEIERKVLYTETYIAFFRNEVSVTSRKNEILTKTHTRGPMRSTIGILEPSWTLEKTRKRFTLFNKRQVFFRMFGHVSPIPNDFFEVEVVGFGITDEPHRKGTRCLVAQSFVKPIKSTYPDPLVFEPGSLRISIGQDNDYRGRY